MTRKTKFNPCWKNEENFKGWLSKDPLSNQSFKCLKCQCTLELGNMGRSAFTKHMKSFKHLTFNLSRQSQAAGLMASWTRSSQSDASNESINKEPQIQSNLNTVEDQVIVNSNVEYSEPYTITTPTTNSGVLNTWVATEEVLKAEALWCVYATVNHLSCRASKNTSALFELMFRDSKIANKFSCGKDKFWFSSLLFRSEALCNTTDGTRK